METLRKTIKQLSLPVAGISLLLASLLFGASVSADINPLPEPDPKPGSFGLEARKDQAPPTRGASITTPASGASFTSSPITVNGTCPGDLLVQVFNNNVMVGAAMCQQGSFSLQVSLFSGQNDLSALVYDELGQEGPKSNVVSVTFNDENLKQFGQNITLTSQYGRLSAAATTELIWPLQLSGGTGPYAFSIDWGDGSQPQLVSRALAGVFNIEHVYKRAGIYMINVKVTDTNGVSGFLQLIAVASGKVDNAVATGQANDDKAEAVTGQPKILWPPIVAMWLLLIPAFWLGRSSMKTSLRNKMLKERDAYEKDQSNTDSSNSSDAS